MRFSQNDTIRVARLFLVPVALTLLCCGGSSERRAAEAARHAAYDRRYNTISAYLRGLRNYAAVESRTQPGSLTDWALKESPTPQQVEAAIGPPGEGWDEQKHMPDYGQHPGGVDYTDRIGLYLIDWEGNYEQIVGHTYRNKLLIAAIRYSNYAEKSLLRKAPGEVGNTNRLDLLTLSSFLLKESGSRCIEISADHLWDGDCSVEKGF